MSALKPCPIGRSATICDHVVALVARVDGDPTQRLGEAPPHHLDADRLVTGQLQLGQRAVRLRQRGAAAGDDARLHGRPGRGQRVLDPEHAFLQLDARRAAYPDDRDPPGQPGDPQLEAVPVGVDAGPLELRLQLGDPRVDQARLVAVRADDRRGVLGDGDPVARPQVRRR